MTYCKAAAVLELGKLETNVIHNTLLLRLTHLKEKKIQNVEVTPKLFYFTRTNRRSEKKKKRQEKTLDKGRIHFIDSRSYRFKR